MGMEWAAAARLVRRSGFGATGTDVDAVAELGAAGYVERILAADPTKDPGAVKTPAPTFAPVEKIGKGADDDTKADAKKQHRKQYHEQDQTLTDWWVRRMLAVEQPFGEKLTFAWHAHFATSLKKVKNPAWMYAQNEKQRTLGRGGFDTLAYSMLLDPATQKWLDNQKNTVKGPNENLAREFMEIFTLGHGDGYTENDVRSGARALTGLKINPKSDGTDVREQLHDSGSKTLFGRTGDFGAKDFCDLVLARPGCPKYIVTRMWNQFASNNAPPNDVLDRLLAAYGPKRDLTALLRTMFTDPAFTAAEGSYIVGPVEWLVGAMRTLGIDTSNPKQLKLVDAALTSLGQLPFYPPSVGGWPSGLVWMSTAAADLRFRTAQMLARRAKAPTLTGSTTEKLETLAHFLGVSEWSDRSLAVLKGTTSNVAQLLPVALNTPEYLVH